MSDDLKAGDFAMRLDNHPLVKAGTVHQVTEVFRGGYLGFANPIGGEWNPRGWRKIETASLADVHTSSLDRARAIWSNMGGTPDYLRDTDFERMFKLAAEHFAEVYKCARGHEIDPLYVTALPYDFLHALAAVLAANRE